MNGLDYEHEKPGKHQPQGAPLPPSDAPHSLNGDATLERADADVH